MELDRAPKAHLRLFGAALVTAAIVTTPIASALAADAGAHDDPTSLMVNIQEQWELLSRDCTTACRALQSIQRAADRICELEAGDRCKSAKSKADEAARKVQASCPECVIAQGAPRNEPAPQESERATTKKGSTGADDAMVQAAPAPSESGCRSCSESGTSPSDFAPALFAVLALLGLRKRRR